MTTKDLNKFCKDNNISIDWALKVIRGTRIDDRSQYWNSVSRKGIL